MDQIRVDDIVPANPRQAAVDRTLQALRAEPAAARPDEKPKAPRTSVDVEQQITPQRD